MSRGPTVLYVEDYNAASGTRSGTEAGRDLGEAVGQPAAAASERRVRDPTRRERRDE